MCNDSSFLCDALYILPFPGDGEYAEALRRAVSRLTVFEICAMILIMNRERRSYMKHRIIAAAAAVTAAAAAIPAQAFALDEGFEKKNVTAYLYSMDKSEELECLFSRELPEVPYVSMEDFLDRIYTVDLAGTTLSLE